MLCRCYYEFVIKFKKEIRNLEKYLPLKMVYERFLGSFLFQVLMELEEIFPAVESAQRAIHLRPNWAQGHQTLGRSLLNTGHLNLVCQVVFFNAQSIQSYVKPSVVSVRCLRSTLSLYHAAFRPIIAANGLSQNLNALSAYVHPHFCFIKIGVFDLC